VKDYSTCCTVEANYWQTRSIARPLCDSRTTCSFWFVNICVSAISIYRLYSIDFFAVDVFLCHLLFVDVFFAASLMNSCLYEVRVNTWAKCYILVPSRRVVTLKQASHWRAFCSRNVAQYGVPSRAIEVRQDSNATVSLVYAMSRISYELFNAWHPLIGNIVWTFQNCATTWHALFHLTPIATHPHAQCHKFKPICSTDLVLLCCHKRLCIFGLRSEDTEAIQMRY